ncbi:MAG: hypothetical protein ACP5DZ_07415, partial [Bacteroidales bacterium]
MRQIILLLILFALKFNVVEAQMVFTFPQNDAIISDTSITFSWLNDNQTNLYVAEDSLFNTLIVSQNNILSNHYFVNGLNYNQKYFAKIVCTTTNSSEIISFYIKAMSDYSIKYWFIANSINDTTLGLVNSWSDSIQNYIVNQSNSTNKPQIIINNSLINNNNTIAFNGDDFLTGYDSFDIGHKSQTIIIFGKVTQNSGYFLAKGPYATTNSYALGIFGNGKIAYLYLDENNCTISGNYSKGSFDIITAITDRQETLNVLAVNNINLSSNNNISNSTYNHNNISNFEIGKSSSYYLNGEIAEIIALDTVLADQGLDTIYSYLRYKYVPPVNLQDSLIIDYGFQDT